MPRRGLSVREALDERELMLDVPTLGLCRFLGPKVRVSKTSPIGRKSREVLIKLVWVGSILQCDLQIASELKIPIDKT